MITVFLHYVEGLWGGTGQGREYEYKEQVGEEYTVVPVQGKVL